MYSFEIPEELVPAVYDLDLTKCILLVEDAFNSYPKESDSIIMIILDAIEPRCVEEKLLIKLLKDYHDYLLKLFYNKQ